jgi:hypothetical protein
MNVLVDGRVNRRRNAAFTTLGRNMLNFYWSRRRNGNAKLWIKL